MAAKVQFLFEMDKLLVRPTPQQREFEHQNYDLLRMMPEKVNNAFQASRLEMEGKPPLSMIFTWFPVTMNGNVLAEIGKEYPQYVKPTGRKNHALILEGGYECYVKKLSEGSLMPSYNHSQTSAAMCEMFALPEQAPLPVIFIGYVLNKTNDKVLGCYAVCIKGRERLWVSDLSALQPPSTGEINLSSPVAPVVTPEPEVAVTVRAKRKAV